MEGVEEVIETAPASIAQQSSSPDIVEVCPTSPVIVNAEHYVPDGVLAEEKSLCEKLKKLYDPSSGIVDIDLGLSKYKVTSYHHADPMNNLIGGRCRGRHDYIETGVELNTLKRYDKMAVVATMLKASSIISPAQC